MDVSPPALPALPPEDCAGGPVTWCQSLAVAQRCGALELCARLGRDRTLTEDTCSDCEQVVTLLTHMLQESPVKQALGQKCQELPIPTMVPMCQELVDKAFALLLTCLEGQVKPGVVCTQLGLCPQGPAWSRDSLLHQLLQGLHAAYADPQALPIPLPLCWMCRSLVGRIKSTIPKEGIAKAVSGLCHLLPGTVAGTCQCLTEKYTVIALQAALGQLGPRLLCGMLLMCVAEDGYGPEAEAGGQAGHCGACLVLAGVGSNSSGPGAKAALLRACASAHLGWEQCMDFIHQHQSRLPLLQGRHQDALAACQDLGLCEAKRASGPKHCSLGPVYWCSSMEAAKECGALKHCQDHVWG
ncbi:pulmonary surfactant-associated protein B [Alligator mississippiensis]|uniref:pulmonary surfactant-associated protein B n=1 Tax=Alligator mississippiensis TaxID=8496 RepID=UPI002877B13A|nr:pulmonary surfactant-associated protein B [Alligator mississippiensis]